MKGKDLYLPHREEEEEEEEEEVEEKKERAQGAIMQGREKEEGGEGGKEGERERERPATLPEGAMELDYTKYLRGRGTPDEPFEYTNKAGETWLFDHTTQEWKKQAPLATLIAQQQAIYKAPVPSEKQQQQQQQQQNKKNKKKKNKNKKPQNTSVYVTGLPEDITQEEVISHFSKCGLIKKDPQTALPKVKIYTTEEGIVKGDARVTYFRPESVSLALSILDGSEIRPGSTLTVTEAVFDQKIDPNAPKKKTQKSKKVRLYDQSKELSWDDFENCHVVIKHMFVPEEANGDVFFFDELKEELEEECEKIGPVEKVKVFERNPEGVVIVKFKEAISANKCVQRMNNRFFGGRQLESFFYDGWTNYDVRETQEEQEERLNAFGDWLEQDSD